MKKTIALFLSLLILCSMAGTAAFAEETTPTMRVSKTTAAQGGEAVVTVSLENNPGIIGMTLGFDYDTTRLELLSYQESGLTGTWQKGARAVWASNVGDTKYNGVFLTLTFKVLDAAPLGNAEVTVLYSPGDICNNALEDVNFTVVPGGVSVVCNHVWGDWHVTVEPTLEADGTEERECSVCHETETRSVKAQTVVVGFDAAGGTAVDSVTLLKGGSLSALPATSREGYSFDGWYTAAEGGSAVTLETAFSADATVYARWTAETSDKPAITVSTVKAKPGEEVAVKISLANNPGIAGITIKFKYDSALLTYTGYEEAGLTGWTVGKAAVWVNSENYTADGDILILKFKVNDNAPEGLAAVSLEVQAGNADEAPVQLETIYGGVNVVLRVPGDANGDGTIDVFDLIKLKKNLAGVTSAEINTENSDVNGDGKVDVFDLIRIQKYLAGVEGTTLQ